MTEDVDMETPAETPSESSARLFEEPPVDELPEKVENNKEGSDKFGKTPLPSGDAYLRKKKKVGKMTDHIRLQKHLTHTRKRDRKAAQRAELAAILDPCEGGAMSPTKVYSQADIVRHADVQTMQKKFALTLEMGPYVIDYDASGRHLLLAGRRGHIAMIDHLTKQPKAEFSTNEVVTDAIFLQNEKMMAVAQKKWTYVYDNQGIELHCLKTMNNVNRLTYLPHHFLLSAINTQGYLQYIDISVGKEISICHTNEQGSGNNVMCLNPTNGIVHLGHANGTVTLWSPNQKTYVAKMLCHRSNVLSACVSPSGHYMATSSQDAMIKVWDLRNWRCVATHRLPKGAHQMQFSQTGRLGSAFGNIVEVWKDPWLESCESPMMRYESAVFPERVKFCPFEDVLGIGSKTGFESILVPGAGEPNPDSWQYNPFQTKKQRAETEVRMLLEKCPAETITLDPHILAKLDSNRIEELDEEKLKRVGFKPERKFQPKQKQRGKNKARAKEARKAMMRNQEMRKMMNHQQQRQKAAEKRKEAQAKDVLARFMKKDT